MNKFNSILKIFYLFVFLLSAQVTFAQESATPEERPAHSENPSLSPQYWAHLGAGVTQSQYSQSVPQFVDIAISDDLGPALHFDAGAWWSWHWGMNAYFKNTPGTFKSSSATEVQNGSYNFRRAGLEVLYRTHPLFEGQRKETFLKLGLHQHDLPFLTPVTPVVLSQQNSRVRTVGFGIEHHRELADRWKLEGFLRYQYPYTSGVTPHFYNGWSPRRGSSFAEPLDRFCFLDRGVARLQI
jgi:hypothetical protein